MRNKTPIHCKLQQLSFAEMISFHMLEQLKSTVHLSLSCQETHIISDKLVLKCGNIVPGKCVGSSKEFDIKSDISRSAKYNVQATHDGHYHG